MTRLAGRHLALAVVHALVVATTVGAASPPSRTVNPHRSTMADDEGAACGVDICPVDLRGENETTQAICHPQDWALKQIGMQRYWELAGEDAATGRGVTIAHIDTGYTDNPALPVAGAEAVEDPRSAEVRDCAPFSILPRVGEGGIVPDQGFDYQAGCRNTEQCGPRAPEARKDPYDPQLPAHFVFDRQPGHGTGTLGMITSPGVCFPGSPGKAPRFLMGVAPGARVIPFRFANGVILTETRSNRMVEAVLNAVTTQRSAGVDAAGKKVFRPLVDVVTISQGRRSPTAELEEAILTAERSGVIVVAASGEYPAWSPVRFPAQYPTVVGVTGTRVDGRPWSGIFGAGRGPSAAIAAPAFRVWHAETKVKGGKQCASAVTGKGTSFSAPLVAGAAALWLEKYNKIPPGGTQGKLAETYGASAVPALFRYFLRSSGDHAREAFRSPAELCRLAREEAWPNVTSVCRHESESWDTSRWGQGVLAVDKLLSVPKDAFPDAQSLCRDVYLKEGVEAWNRACPIGSPGRQEDESTTAGVVQEGRPAQERTERLTRVAGVSFGRPFGRPSGRGPAIDYGVIFSQHYYQAPRGAVAQLQYAQGGNVGVAVGYAAGFGYDPYRDSKRSWSVFNGFSPAASIAVKGAYLRARASGEGHANLVGVQIQVGVLKVKGQYGFFRDVTAGRWKSTWDAGVGF